MTLGQFGNVMRLALNSCRSEERKREQLVRHAKHAIIVVSAVWYGLIGVLIGVPLAATINLYRSNTRHSCCPVSCV